MPHATQPEYSHISITQLAPTFGAEINGVDFANPIPPEVFREILDAITTHGVLVFRNADLDDTRHVAFARLFGELDDVKPYLAMGRKNRLPYDELFDVSNLEDDGSLFQINSKRHHMGLGNSIFHVDSSFNPRRAGYSLLRAHTLPPQGTGGNTDFADTRTAYADLPPTLKNELETNNYIGAHSIMHSRKKAAPKDSPWLEHIDPEKMGFGRHNILQIHGPSGRKNLYIANHLHHLEYSPTTSPPLQSVSSNIDSTPQSQPKPQFTRLPEPKSTQLINTLLDHATQDKYLLSIDWRSPGDLLVWDNTAVMHRASPIGDGFTGKYVRDMRRCTVHDSSSLAWGWNERKEGRMALP